MTQLLILLSFYLFSSSAIALSIVAPSEKDKELYRQATKTNDIELCQNIEHEIHRSWCISTVALNKLDEKDCESLESGMETYYLATSPNCKLRILVENQAKKYCPSPKNSEKRHLKCLFDENAIPKEKINPSLSQQILKNFKRFTLWDHKEREVRKFIEDMVDGSPNTWGTLEKMDFTYLTYVLGHIDDRREVKKSRSLNIAKLVYGHRKNVVSALDMYLVGFSGLATGVSLIGYLAKTKEEDEAIRRWKIIGVLLEEIPDEELIKISPPKGP